MVLVQHLKGGYKIRGQLVTLKEAHPGATSRRSVHLAPTPILS